MTCKHLSFDAKVAVARIEDIGRFVAEVRIHCIDCGAPFQFMGVLGGFSYEGPRVSIDGLELNAPICPQGTQPTPLQGLMGYDIKGHN